MDKVVDENDRSYRYNSDREDEDDEVYHAENQDEDYVFSLMIFNEPLIFDFDTFITENSHWFSQTYVIRDVL